MAARRYGMEMTNGSEATTSDQFTVWPFTQSEFIYIRTNFKTEDVETSTKILDLLKMWQWRANDEHERIVIIDLTKLVFQGLVFDYRHVLNQETVIVDSMEYAQLIYGTIVARFVNYINEIYRFVNNTHGNMYTSTGLVGLPSWVVDLRHKVVHSNMPTLDQLRKAVHICRDWLYDTSWNQPLEIAFLSLDVPITRPRTHTTGVSKIILQKLLDRFCMANMASGNDHNSLPLIILELKKLIFTDTKAVAIAIVERFIIKTKEQLDDMGLKYEGENPWAIPTSWKNFWQEIILALQECSVFGVAAVHLSNGVLNAEDIFLKVQYAAWLSHLVDRLKLTGFSIAYHHLAILAENMLKSKMFFTRDKFLYILQLMHPMLPKERKENLTDKWDNEDELTIIDDVTFIADESEHVHFGLVTPDNSLGLVHDQRKDTLNLALPD